MRPVSRNLFRILNNEKFLPVVLLDIQALGADVTSTIRLTDYGDQITWGGNTYTPITMSRSGFEDVLSSDSSESPLTTISISNIDTRMASLLNQTELAGAYATLRIADRRLLSRTRDAVTMAFGEIRDPQITEQTLVFQIANVIAMMDRQTVPRRIYQQNCGYTYGSKACTVNIKNSPFSITGNAQPGTTQYFINLDSSILAAADNAHGTVSGPTDYSEFWANGYILMTSGPAVCQARPFSYFQVVNSENRAYLRYPFLTSPQSSDTFIIRRGCRKTKEDCVDRQGNYKNFGGFEEVPFYQITPSVVTND